MANTPNFGALFDDVPPAPRTPAAPASAPVQTEMFPDVPAMPSSADRLRASLNIMAVADPKQEAERTRLAKELGVPVLGLPSVETAKTEAYLKKYTPEQIAQMAPRTTDWINANESNAKSGAQSLDALIASERAFNAVQMTHQKRPEVERGWLVGSLTNLVESSKQSYYGMKLQGAITDAMQYGYGTAVNTDSAATTRLADDELDKLEQQFADDPSSMARPDVVRMFEARIAKWRALTAESQERVKAVEPTPDSTLGRWVYGGVASTVQAVPGTLAGVALRNPAPILAQFGLTQYGQAYGKYADRSLAAGAPLSSTAQAASTGATVEAAAEVGFETIGAKYLVERFGTTPFREFLGGLLIREMPMELATTVTQKASDYLIANPNATLEQFKATLPEDIGATVTAVLVQSLIFGGAGGVHHAVTGGADRSRILSQDLLRRQAEAEYKLNRGEALSQLVLDAHQNPMREENPDAFKDHIRSLKDEGVDSDVYVNAQELGETFKQSGVTMDEVQRKMSEVAAQLLEAAQFGTAKTTEVRVPIEDFLTHFPTEMAQGVVQKGLAEAEAFYQSQVEENKKLAEQIIANNTQGSQQAEEIAQVREDLVKQLAATGRYTRSAAEANAAPIVAFSVQTARDLGIPVAEFHKQYGFRVAASPLTEGEAFRQLDDAPIVNIGLKRSEHLGGGEITPAEAIEALREFGVEVTQQSLHKSDTENTLVAKLSRPLSKPEVDALSTRLFQDAIPQYHKGEGYLGGPRAAEWGPFNPEYFLLPSGARLAHELNPPLEGLPLMEQGARPLLKARQVAEQYMREQGMPYTPPATYAPVDKERAARIAQAYEDMKHAPQDPEVKAAYEQLAKETIAQYEAIMKTGLKVEFVPPGMRYPYEDNPRMVIDDVRDNNHMWVFSTREGFGSDQTFDPKDNPLLAETKFKISGQTALVNDLFRVVHDYFGHVAEGVGFRAGGEENAWRLHSAMFSPLARRAMTTETRGQNSWVNFGPYGETNRTASGADTHYADQKTGLLPSWVVNEGSGQDVFAQADWHYSELSHALPGMAKIADKEGFVKPAQAKAWLEARQKEGKFKKAELDASGVLDFLDSRPTEKIAVSKIQQFVDVNGFQVEERQFSGLDLNEPDAVQVWVGEFETEDPDTDWIQEQADDVYPEGYLEDIAADEDVNVEDLTEQQRERASEKAFDRALDDYYRDPGSPQHAEATVEIAGHTLKYTVESSYGDLFVYAHDTQERLDVPRNRQPEEVMQDHAIEYAAGEGWLNEGDDGPAHHSEWITDQGENYTETLIIDPTEMKFSGVLQHFGGEPNILAHILHSDKIAQDGTNLLVAHEIQSDWAQQGRDKGFEASTEKVWVVRLKDGGAVMRRVGTEAEAKRIAEGQPELEVVEAERVVPAPVTPGPFVTDTKAWTALALKRMLYEAADKNADLAWSMGETVADRYSLDKHITGLLYSSGVLEATRNGVVVFRKAATEEELPGIVGKELAAKLLATEPHANGSRLVSGLDLNIGGEGMRGYYDKIVPQVLGDVLKKLGYKEKPDVVTDSTGKQYHRIKLTGEIRNKILEGMPLFQQNNAQFSPSTLTATFLKGANLSSVIHEAGHYYLEVLTRIAARPDAPQRIRDDVDTTMKWFGIKGDTAEERVLNWRNMSIDEQRPFHEQWAESNERWALEGKSPTIEMQGTFARFRAWLLNVYKSMEEFLQKNPGAGKLNDEIRGVFSRMMASEEQIAYAEQVRAYAPLFDSAEEAGKSEEQFRKYMQLDADATNAAVASLQNRSLRDMRWLSNAKDRAIRRLQLEEKEARTAIRGEVTKQVMNEPIEQAKMFLSKGEVVSPTGEEIKAAKGYKLDTETLKQLYPATGLDSIDLTKLRRYSGKDGLHPDLVAQMFGLPSGDALVRELLSGEDTKSKIDGLTDARMLEEHGELVDSRAVELAAEAAIHNEARARFLATGLKILSKTPGSVRDIAKASKEAAEQMVAAKKVRDLRPGQYTKAEERANKEAIKQAPSNPAKAAEAQRAALLSNQLARATLSAMEEVKKDIAYLKKFDNIGTRKNIDFDYISQIDEMLKPFDIDTGISLRDIDKRKSLSDWIAEQEEMGLEPAIDPEQVAKLSSKHYKDMTMEELRGLVDSIRQVEHLGRLKKKLLTAKDAKEFATRIAEANASIRQLANRTVPERETPTDVAGRIAATVRGIAAQHRQFASLLREMDGGKDGGTMWELLVRPMNEAGDNETEMRFNASERLAALFEPVAKQISDGNVVGNLWTRKAVVPGTNISMTHEQRIMFAMNWGNLGNRQRLLDGGLSGRKAISANEAQAILDTLTKPEWDFVQGVLDFVGSYRQQIAEQERRLTGVEPEWVEPAPIQTKFGVYPGGYFPAKYDANLSTRSESLEAMTDLRMAMKGVMGRAATRNGYAKARAAEVSGRPLLLSFDVIGRHVNEVVHRVAWQDWVVDANRVINALDDPIRTHYGPEVLNELRKTVQDIATGDSVPTGATERALTWLRNGSTIVGLGWRFTTAIGQVTGLGQSIARVGTKWVGIGLTEFAKNPIEAGEFVNSKSKLMRDRGRTMQREVNDIMNTVRVGEKVSALKASYFWSIAKMQRSVDIPTWLGAYNKALAEMKYENAASEEERASIDARASALADQAIIESQSAGQLKDLARIQRGHPMLKLFTNFFSYAVNTYNLNVGAFRRTDFSNPLSAAAFISDMVAINIVPALLMTLIKEGLKSSCDDGDVECLMKKVGRDQVSYLMAQTILTREAGAAVDVAFGGQWYGYHGPAGVRFFNDLGDAFVQSWRAWDQGADFKTFKAWNNVGGSLLHYPAGQINATVEGAIAIENGDVEGTSALKAVLAGPPKN